MSAKKHPKVMAKIYEYSTQSIYNILKSDKLKADYIDVKGDGVFAVYSGDNAIEKAFVAGITLKSFFDEVKLKFKTNNLELKCKIALDIDKVLVKRLGSKKHENEVWAGHLINNCYKMMSYTKTIASHNNNEHSDKNIMVISNDIHSYLEKNHNEYALLSCHPKIEKLWEEIKTKKEADIKGDEVWYCVTKWCPEHGEFYANKILNINYEG